MYKIESINSQIKTLQEGSEECTSPVFRLWALIWDLDDVFSPE